MRPHTFQAPEALVDGFSHNVSWMVKEPVMVLWEEEEAERHQEPDEEPDVDHCRMRLRSLGQPSTIDKYPNVTLWIGRGCSTLTTLNKDGKEEMIVLLQMTFHIKVSSGNRKKAFDMFCILSSADLVMSCPKGNFFPLSINNLSPTVYDCLKHPESSRRLLHIRFCAKQPSRVLMHHRPHIAKHVTGTPLHLMLLLKSLSCTLSFDAYLSYSTYAAECLKTVATKFDSAMTTPAINIDLHRVYAGVGGCFDYWEQFNPEHFAPLQEAQHAQQSPPRYSSPTHPRPCTNKATRKRPRSCSSSSLKGLGYPLPHAFPAVQEKQQETEKDYCVIDVPPPSYSNRETSPPAFPSTPLALPPTPLAFPPIATTSSITHSPTVLVSESELHTSPDQTTVDFSDYVPDTSLDDLKETCTPDAAITIGDSPSSEGKESAEHSVSVASPPLVPTLTCLFRSCILDMNTLSPDFYKLPRFHLLLLSLASAATSGSKNDFIQAKAKATTSVLVLARDVPDKREKDKDVHQISNLNLLRELDLLLQWMYSHDLDATGPEPGHKYGHGPLLTCLRQLAAWAAAFRNMLKTCAAPTPLVKETGDGPSHAGKPEALIQGFRQWEAECVAHFYLSLVAKVGKAC